MSTCLRDRHKRLQERLRSEMDQQTQASNQQGSAAASADRSSAARALRVRSLREEREATGHTAACGADNSTRADFVAFAQIPGHLLAHFKAIPDSDGGIHPPILSMTQQEQDFMGENMGLEMHEWRLLVKSPVLALPHTPHCQYWLAWAVANKRLPEGSRCMMMSPNAYESSVRNPCEIVTHHGIHSADQQDVHVKAHGYPMAVWQWVVSPDWEGDALDDAFELVGTSTNQEPVADAEC